MTERAQVLSVDGPTATVRCDTTEACSSCTSILCNPRARTYEALIDGPAELPERVVPGAVVEVEVPSSGAIGKAVLLFGLPLLLFAAVYLATGSDAPEVARAAGGFGGLAAGLLATVAIGRAWKDPLPRIVRVYARPEGSPELVPFDWPVDASSSS